MKKLFLVLLIAISSQAQIISDGTIAIDTDTGLIWEDQETIQNLDWYEAIDYCQALQLADFDDWRLPNRNELLSITDKTKYNPSIKDGFINYKTSTYWTSSTSAGYSRDAWVVSFDSGYDYYYYLKSNERYVRCVRAGQ
jgi:hypothetical protein